MEDDGQEATEESTSSSEQSPETFTSNLAIVTARLQDRVQRIAGSVVEKTRNAVLCDKCKEEQLRQGVVIDDTETQDAIPEEATCVLCKSKVMLGRVKNRTWELKRQASYAVEMARDTAQGATVQIRETAQSAAEMTQEFAQSAATKGREISAQMSQDFFTIPATAIGMLGEASGGVYKSISQNVFKASESVRNIASRARMSTLGLEVKEEEEEEEEDSDEKEV